VRVPLPGPGWRGAYEKLRVRDSIDYPLLGVALLVRWEDGPGRVIGEVKLALTAVNPRPEVVPGTEAFAGQPMTSAVVEALARLAHRTGKPMRTAVADPAYRGAMIIALVEKAATRLAPELQEALAGKARWV
jgi:4-hydroxybenzoyl-CoA reductase subunit beta